MDDAASASDIASLRRGGQQALDDVLKRNARQVERLIEGRTPRDNPEAQKFRAFVDQIARQHDAYASGLFWYTDLEAAKAEAKKTHRHILSLRLLGNLDEEYSCANSRFFRTVLYANAEVSEHLRKNYVLHWKSVRPAPLVTIEMGDGRRIKRTITGNSIHYVLNSDGTVLDALPGLYGPQSFLGVLARSEALIDPTPESLRKWHGDQANGLCRAWLSDAVRARMYGDGFSSRVQRGTEAEVAACLTEAFPSQQVRVVPELAPAPEPKKPNEFAPFAVAKSMVERPISRLTSPSPLTPEESAAKTQTSGTASPATPAPPSDSDTRPLVARMNPDAWQRIATLHLEECRLDRGSIALMLSKLGPDDSNSSQSVVDQAIAFDRMRRRFENSIALDTVHNEYGFHTQIHQWMEEDTADVLRRDVETLNKRVYADLFLTPDYDAWLGLVPDDTYTALDKDGCACDKGAPKMK